MTQEEVEPAEVVQQPAEIAPIRKLFVGGLRTLRIGAGENPVPFAIGDDRRLEVDVGRGALVVQALGELQCTLDVLTSRLEVAPAPVAAGAPGEDVRTQLIGADLGALGQLQRFVEQADRGLDAVQLVAPDAESKDHVGALDIGETGALGESPGALEERDRLPHLSPADADRGLARQRARLELGQPGREHRRTDPLELLERFVVAPRLEESICARECGIDTSALVGRNTVRQVARVDTQSVGEPLDRLGRGFRLAALDLADVLLRESLARQVRLGHPPCDAQLAQTLAEA